MATTSHLSDGNRVHVTEEAEEVRLKLDRGNAQFVQLTEQRGPVWVAATSVTYFEAKRSGKTAGV